MELIKEIYTSLTFDKYSICKGYILLFTTKTKLTVPLVEFFKSLSVVLHIQLDIW